MTNKKPRKYDRYKRLWEVLMYKPHKKAKQKIESFNRAHKTLTAKGLPAAVIQLGEKTTRARVKRAFYGNFVEEWCKDNFKISTGRCTFKYCPSDWIWQTRIYQCLVFCHDSYGN